MCPDIRPQRGVSARVMTLGDRGRVAPQGAAVAVVELWSSV